MSETLTAENTGPTKVFVDGIEQPECVAVNPEEGWADIARPDLYVSGDEIPTVRITGEIRLEPVVK